MDLIGNDVDDIQILTDISGVGDFLAAAVVGLYKNDVVPSRDLLLAAYTTADYSGYAEEAVTWLVPSVADDGEVEMVGIVGEFRPTGAVIQNTVFGIVLKTAGGELVQAARFDLPPLPMGGVDDSILVTLRVRLTLAGMVVTVS